MSDFPTLAARPSRAHEFTPVVRRASPIEVPRAWVPIAAVFGVFLTLGAWAMSNALEGESSFDSVAKVARKPPPRPTPADAPLVIEVGSGAEPDQAEPAQGPEPAEVATTAPSEEPEPAEEIEEREPRRRVVRHVGPGTLNLLAIPSATVRLDGRVIGVTPLIRRQLPAGTHRLQLRSADGRSKTVTVSIRPGRSTRLRVEL